MTGPVRPGPWRAPSPLPAPHETPRLVLRFYAPSDARSMLEALNEDRASFLPWLPWVEIDNRNDTEVIFNIERFRRTREDPNAGDFVVAIADRASGAIVGGTGFHRVNHATHEAEIGYWMRPSRRGEGLCTEAVGHMLEWGFAPVDRGGWGFRRIHIAAAAKNVASCRVPEKLGLPKEIERRHDRWIDGLGWSDTIGWGTTADAWASRRQR
jgi:ribosomal-protein-serine acetyltransferase